MASKFIVHYIAAKYNGQSHEGDWPIVAETKYEAERIFKKKCPNVLGFEYSVLYTDNDYTSLSPDEEKIYRKEKEKDQEEEIRRQSDQHKRDYEYALAYLSEANSKINVAQTSADFAQLSEKFSHIARTLQSLPSTFEVKAYITECETYRKQCEDRRVEVGRQETESWERKAEEKRRKAAAKKATKMASEVTIMILGFVVMGIMVSGDDFSGVWGRLIGYAFFILTGCGILSWDHTTDFTRGVPVLFGIALAIFVGCVALIMSESGWGFFLFFVSVGFHIGAWNQVLKYKV
jgi:hypothetical protein